MPPARAGRGLEQIEGRMPVIEALRSGRPLRRILVARGVAPRGVAPRDAIRAILDGARAAGVRVDRVPREAIDARAHTPAHQGVLAEVEPYRYRSWREAVEAATAGGVPPLLLALDGITDPGNLGSLLRSAESLGCHGILLPGRRSAQLGPVVEKAAAGAVGHLIIDRVGSLERALAACRKEGLWLVGLDARGKEILGELELLTEPLVLIVGSEGSGLSRLVRDRVDALARIPAAGSIESLSAPVAGAIALYEAHRRRTGDRR